MEVRPKLSVAEKERYYKMIWWLRKHPVHALWLLFGVKLAPHQRITFRHMWDASVIGLKLSRGLSKTFLDGLYLVLKAVLYSNATQIVLTRGFRGGKLVLRESCQAVLENSLAGQSPRFYGLKCLANFQKSGRQTSMRIINKDPDLWVILFTHGSNIQTGPLGKDVQKTSPLRGLRANTTLVLDESADIGDELYNSVIRPFTRVAPNPVAGATESRKKTSTRIESGTIKYDWQRYTKELMNIEDHFRKGDKSYALVEFNYEDCYHWINNVRPKDYIQDIRQHVNSGNVIFTYRLNIEDIFDELANGGTSWEDFLSENKNRTQVSAGTEFPSQLLDSITGVEVEARYLDEVNDTESIFYDPDKYDRTLFPLLESSDPCILGVDPARESDDAAFALIRLGPCRHCHAPFCDLINAQAFNKKTFQQLYDVIREYLDKFPGIKKIVMDAGGGGYAIRDLLWRPYDGRIPIYDPSDEATPPDVRDMGLPILQLDASNNEKNTTRVNYLKGQMQAGKFLLPPFVYFTGNRDLDNQYRNIKKFRQQCSYIVSSPSGNFKRYYVEGSYKKDLFSASLLAMQGVYDELYVDTSAKIITELDYV